MIGGVCGGIAEHLELDPTLVRLLAVFGFFAGAGSPALAYIICWIIIPEREFGTEGEGLATAYSEPGAEPAPGWHSFLPGLILIGIGVVILVRQYWLWFDFGDFWPVVLILVGVGLIFFASSGGRKSKGQAGNEPANGQQGGLS